MVVLVQLALVLMLKEYSSNTIFTEKYTKQSISYMNMVAIRRINTSLLKCCVRCPQPTSRCSTNTQQNLNMSTGRCDESKGCVGFRFANCSCPLYTYTYIQQKQTLKKAEVTKTEMYLKSGFMEVENRGITSIASTVNMSILKESETTPPTTNIKFHDRTASYNTKSSSTKHEETGGKRNIQTPIKSTAKFGSQCSKNDQCDYDHGLCLSGKCSCRIGHSFDFNSNTCVTPKFGSQCSKNDQCDYDHGLCLSGKCSCRFGHSFDLNSNTCVTRCEQYGKTFSMYPNSSVVSCNLSPVSCQRKCNKEKWFVCINAEYIQLDFSCFLCNKT